MFKSSLIVTLSLFTSIAFADPNFSNLSKADFEKIINEFSSNFSHHSVMGAKTLGSVYGFEFGLVAGQTASPDTEKIAKRGDPRSDLPNLYNGGLLLGVSVPFGVTGELVMIPSTSMSGATAEVTSIGLKWTMNQDVLQVIPFNLALRASQSTSKFSFKQTISGQDATVSNENKITGIELLASPDIPWIEPYVGVGYFQADDTLKVTGTTGTVFDTTFTASQTASSNPYSMQYLLGVNYKLGFFSTGLEYHTSFGTSGYNLKLAAAF